MSKGKSQKKRRGRGRPPYSQIDRQERWFTEGRGRKDDQRQKSKEKARSGSVTSGAQTDRVTKTQGQIRPPAPTSIIAELVRENAKQT